MSRIAAPPSVHAVVLAGGQGTRMPPLVSPDYPKALLTVCNRPMLFYPLFALYRAAIRSVTLVIQPEFSTLFHDYIHTHFPADPAVTALALPALSVTLHETGPDDGTADVLRRLQISAHDVVVLSADTISDISLLDALTHHRYSNAVCTTTLTINPTSPSLTSTPSASPSPASTGKKGTKKQSSKSSPPATKHNPPPEIYALHTPQDRLLLLLHRADITSDSIHLPTNLIRRYHRLRLRTDLEDPHVYILHSRALARVLAHCPAISSVKYELVPYLARRQHTLSRVADRGAWRLPGDDVSVSLFLAPERAFATRANTVANFRAANADGAAGRFTPWLTAGLDATGGAGGGSGLGATGGKKKGKKGEGKPRAEALFETAGDRVSVTPDSAIGKGVTAGDRTSVKKSVVGDGCTLGANVKLNGCVLLSNVTVADGVNLTACVICSGASIGADSVLKECRVAHEGVVEDGTEASDRDFSKRDANALSLGEELGGNIEFC